MPDLGLVSIATLSTALFILGGDTMQNTRYTWDENKHKANINKHRISFAEAVTVFDDPNAITEYDEEHSYDEERFSVIGLSKNTRLLLVCHCYRNGDTLVRIISARKATKLEYDKYMEANE